MKCFGTDNGNYNLLRNIVHEDIYLVATDSGIGLKFN